MIWLFFNQVPPDPVEAIRQQRAIVQNISESQLQQYRIPLGTPPPLPPIKTHPKDLKHNGKTHHKSNKHNRR